MLQAACVMWLVNLSSTLSFVSLMMPTLLGIVFLYISHIYLKWGLWWLSTCWTLWRAFIGVHLQIHHELGCVCCLSFNLSDQFPRTTEYPCLSATCQRNYFISVQIYIMCLILWLWDLHAAAFIWFCCRRIGFILYSH